MSPDPASDRRQVAFLDHVYAVVDEVTADDIARCDYLSGFGRFEVATTVADAETWTGRYLFGRSTYVEIFGPTDLEGPDAKQGSTGVGLSTHKPGALALLTERLESTGVPVTASRRTRRVEGQHVPWFDWLSPADATDAMSVWVMHLLENPSDLERRRSAYDTWVAQTNHTGRAAAQPYITAVDAVEVAATPRDISLADQVLTAAGFSRTHVSQEQLVIRDPAATMTFLATSQEAVGLRRIGFPLAHPVTSRHVERIGGSTLTVGPGHRAVWSFDVR